MTGIYKITNKFNGKIYIGQSINIGNRRNQHFVALNRRKHKNKSLQEDFNKYYNFFSFEIVELCSAALLNEREKFYILLYQSHLAEFGYNKSLAPFKRKSNVNSIKKYRNVAKYRKKKT